MRFADQIVLITGASRGIGAATALACAREGATVIANYRTDVAAADKLSVAAGDRSGVICPVQADVTDSAAVRSMVEHVLAQHGRIDVLVNNAGITKDTLVPVMEDHEWDTVMDTNVAGAFRLARAVARPMMMARRGRIVNVSSVAATKGGRGQVNYAASKAALEGFTRALAVELAPRNIAVNAVAPGIIETRMSEFVRNVGEKEARAKVLLGRFGQPEEVARAVLFLASAEASYITGTVLAVDGGFKMA